MTGEQGVGEWGGLGAGVGMVVGDGGSRGFGVGGGPGEVKVMKLLRRWRLQAVCLCESVYVFKSAFWSAHVSGCVCVASGPFVCLCMHRMVRVRVLCRILDEVGTLPEDGWRVFFSAFPQHIVETIRPKEASGWQFFGFLAPGWKQVQAGGIEMELLISLTSPCCRYSAWSGCDECLITRNTSQIAKSLPALNSKMSSHLQ